MSLIDLIQRDPIPAPWIEGEKIPEHKPEFSRRIFYLGVFTKVNRPPAVNRRATLTPPRGAFLPASQPVSPGETLARASTPGGTGVSLARLQPARRVPSPCPPQNNPAQSPKNVIQSPRC